MQKEEAQELTEKLDQEWKSIQALMVKKTPKAESADKPEEKPKVGPDQLAKHVLPLISSRVRHFLFFFCVIQLEEYDMMVRELGFEMKAQPSEKMKTPEELAREEREKLQKLEASSPCRLGVGHFLSCQTCQLNVLSLGSFLQADRLRRMMGDEVGDSSQSQVHMSADDLNDGFILDKEDKKTLSYQVNWFRIV